MNIISIGLDPKLLDPSSPAFIRQQKYFEGHDTLTIFLAPGDYQEITKPNFRVVRVAAPNKRAAFFATRRFLLAETKKKKYHLILAQDVLASGLLGRSISRRRNIPLITQLHGNYLDNPLWIKQRKSNILWNRLGKRILKKSAAVRVVSRRILDDIEAWYGIPPERVISIPIGSDLSMFKPEGKKASDKTIVLFVGRLIEEKSPLLYVKMMVELMKRHDDLFAAIAGEGDLQGEMKKGFEEVGFGDRAIFLGNLSPAPLAEWYRSSVCLVHTAAWEGWGMPMIESLGCGCPVVTTDTGCANEAIIDNRNGFVVPIDDLVGLTASTEKLLSDKALREKFSANAVKDTKDWSFDVLKSRLLTFYQRYAKKD